MPTRLVFDELTLEAVSRAGSETWLRVHPPGLAIDVGRGSPRLTGVRDVFLTHGHLDHVLGLPYQLSVRTQVEQPPLRIYCPKRIEAAVRRLLEAAGDLDGRTYHDELLGVEAGDRIDLGDGLSVRPFETDHVVPSLGYHLIRRRRRLRPDLMGEPQERLAELAREGREVDESFEELWLSCTGDTAATVFESVPELFESRVLVVECTFLLEGHEDRATRFKHVHLDDLVALRDRFRNRALVLCHLSSRHRPEELLSAARSRLEPCHPEIHVVG